MTKYKSLQRVVQHLTDYQMNGRFVRRAAEYRAAKPDRENAARHFNNGRISNGWISDGPMANGQAPTFAPLREWSTPSWPLPATGMAEAAGRLSNRP
jgi:hypothetical protein